MHTKTLLALMLSLAAGSANLAAQNRDQEERTSDVQQQNRFWQASVGGGHYMVALDRITSVSRHKYVLDGAVIVDEVTVDTVGQSLARFYFIRPITDAGGGTAIGEAASRAVDRARELVDRGAQVAGTEVHNMVIKKFPETTHARAIEYRMLSETELSALYSSVRTAWESGRGRKFAVK
jgi:hypothetical protein